MKQWCGEVVTPALPATATLVCRRAVRGLTVLLFAWLSVANAEPRRVLVQHPFVRRRRLACPLSWLLLVLATLSAAAAVPKRVLLVNSFGNAAPPFTTASTAFETALTEEMGEPVDLDEVSLDVARYATLDMEEALVELIRKRQARWQPDLVVPIGSPAGIFVAQYRDRLFPKTTPIIYAGMDQRRLPPGALQQNATFIGSSYDLPGLVEDILQVAPATTNIVVVIGATPLEQFWTDVLRQEYQIFTNRVGFTWFNDLSFDQMLERSAKLPPHSFMLFILLMRDATGVHHNADQALRRIHEVASAPVNGLFKNQLGMGIVGGRLYADELEGVESAHIAVRILRGEPATNFPPKIIGPLGPRYDWRELQRWNISENRLPPGSIVQFREPTVWGRYWRPITGTVLFCLLQAALIVSLLINWAKRRRREEEATLIADISSKFVNLPPGEVDHEIQDAQRRIFELLDLDVSGFWQWSAEASGFFRLTHHSRASEGPQIPERMNSQEYFPWYQQQVLAGRTIAVRSMTELPPEAARDRETFRQFGFKSNLTIPLSVGGEPPIGALGFNTTRSERDWPDALVRRLQLVAQIFANALARKYADQALRESEERMRMSQQAARVGTFDWNIKTGVSIWTPELEAIHGLPPGGFGKSQPAWESLVHPDDRAEALQRVELAFQTGQPVMGEWRVIWPDRSVHWLVGRFQVFKDESGEPVRMTGVNIDITERKRAQEELQESEARFRTVANTAPVLIWMSGTDKLYNFFNKSWLDFTGRSLEAELGNGWTEGIHKDDLPKCLKIYTESFEARRSFTMEYRLRRHDGEYRWISDHGVPRYDSAQDFLGYIGSCLDITERKRAEEALKESEEMLQSIFVSTPDSITVVDLEGRIKHCNQSAAHIHGFSSADQLLGKNVAELVAGEDRQRMPEVKQHVMTHGIAKDVPFVGLKGSGGKFAGELSFSVLKDGSGKTIGFVGITRDVTERKRTEDALRASELKYRNLVEMTGTGYLIIDVQGRVLDANREYVRISGHGKLREIIGRSVIEWTAEKEKQRNAEAVTQCAKDGFIENFVTEYTDASGKPTFVEVNASVEGEGESRRIVSLCRDITARKHAEAEAQQQRAELTHLSRVNMLGELAGSLAHELSQPLTAVLSNAQAARRFLARDQPNLDEVREILADIVAEDKRAGEIIHRLRSLLKKGEVQRQPCNVNEIVHEVLKIVRSDLVNQNLTAQTELALDLPTLHGDRVQLQQVLLNLVMNGCDAMAGTAPDRRQLTIHTGLDGADVVRVSVTDCGAGIAPEKLDQVFEPFYTSKPHGLGLGLAVCRTIVSAHGGKLWATNNPGRGATFHFTLPIRDGGTSQRSVHEPPP